jgi:hypothetical protein
VLVSEHRQPRREEDNTSENRARRLPPPACERNAGERGDEKESQIVGVERSGRECRGRRQAAARLLGAQDEQEEKESLEPQQSIGPRFGRVEDEERRNRGQREKAQARISLRKGRGREKQGQTSRE